MKHKLVNSVIKSDYIRTLLQERGILDVERFLHPTINDIQDPFRLNNMKEGLRLIDEYIKPHNKICLIVDCDCDGYCSAAIMYQFLKEIEPKIEIEYLIHEGKAHGFSEHIMYLVNNEYDLIICPDAGSNDKVRYEGISDNEVIINE